MNDHVQMIKNKKDDNSYLLKPRPFHLPFINVRRCRSISQWYNTAWPPVAKYVLDMVTNRTTMGILAAGIPRTKSLLHDILSRTGK